ncbi:Basic-leucine zipper domain protein [Kalmanozyma brasiliensis GHG001]|uniref:BZIP domain-containing protein n=1 Tax=Kalmanozyma brasiliensis (strain GHG001) TaxID=1365824 RepID=V5GM07_KALBG|nr:Basic-leucine zipper domain protein [Kalmanozyma brasiliensis GHG001]EST06992.1 Basic-leucine zipper domain protein [Kalmanozyma brasiliensis GHG001]
MAATQVARNSSFAGFDDPIKMPSSPTLQPRARTISNAASVTTSSSTAPAAFNMRKVGLDENQPPPPPGSSPEVFFRYYLAVELRKAGTQPSEALLDRYVRNHFDSLFKNKNGGAASTAAAGPATASSSSGRPHAQAPQQPHASTSQVTVAAVMRPSVPQPKAAAAVAAPAVAPVEAPLSVKDTTSPPELDAAESPAFSGSNYSPVATPPVLNSINEDDALVDFSTVFGEPSSSLLEAPSQALGSQPIKFEQDDSENMLGFFRNSPFRTTDYETATIDPHVVENVNGAAPFSMPLGSISPAALAAHQSQPLTFSTSQLSLKQDDSVAPMSEDGMSDDDDDNDHSRHSSPDTNAGGSNKALSHIPMAVGDINYLKPDPEEYKKLSSKEKRQLRNKISARNFRTRRKEYIGQLEDQIADRDTLIEGLRQQVSQLSVENKALKDEVKTIKARTISSQDVGKILEALQTMTSAPGANAGLTSGIASTSGVTSGRASPTQEMPLTPGAFLNFGDASSSSRPSTPTLAMPGSPRSQSPRPSLLRANTKKDLAPSSSFWGGVGSAVGASTSFMPVC